VRGHATRAGVQLAGPPKKTNGNEKFPFGISKLNEKQEKDSISGKH
jgi:hypothetical protein